MNFLELSTIRLYLQIVCRKSGWANIRPVLGQTSAEVYAASTILRRSGEIVAV